MRYYILLVVLLIVSLVSTANATVMYGTTNGSPNGTQTASVTLSSSIQANDVMYCFFTSTGSTVTDATKPVVQVFTTPPQTANGFFLVTTRRVLDATEGSSQTFDSGTGHTIINWTCRFYRDVATSSIEDGTGSTNTGTTGTTASPAGALTTANRNETALFAAIDTSRSVTFTSPSGASWGNGSSNNANAKSIVSWDSNFYPTSSSTGIPTTGGMTTGDNWAAVMIPFKSLSTISIIHQPDSGAPDFSCGENAASSNSASTGTDANLTAGNILLIAIEQGGPNIATSVINSITNSNGVCTLNGGCIWHQVPNVQDTYLGGAGRADLWWAVLPASGTNGTGVTINGSTDVTFIGNCMMEVAGLNSSTIKDQVSGTTVSSATTSANTPTISGNYAPELFIALGPCQNTGTTVTGTGWLQFGPTNGIGGCPGGFKLRNTTGTDFATLGQSPAGTWDLVTASLIGTTANLTTPYNNITLLPE